MPTARDLRLVFLPVALAAVAIRGWMFYSYWHSALPAYSQVVGLDMAGLINIGRFLYRGAVSFNFHAALTGTMVHFFGLQTGIHLIILTQMLGGVIMSLAVTYVALYWLKRRWVAVLAGVLAAAYTPELLYEAVTLKESTALMLGALALAAAVWMYRCRFSSWSLVFGGMVTIWPGWVRFTGLLWFVALCGWLALVERRRWSGRLRLKKLSLFGSGALLWVLLLIGFNTLIGAGWWPFMFDRYNLRLSWAISSKSNMNSLNIDAVPDSSPVDHGDQFVAQPKKWLTVSDRVLRAVHYAPQIFQPYEWCDNINYYYFRDRMNVLSWLLRPTVLLPLAVTGFLLMLLTGRWRRRREGLILLYAAVFALPLACWVPVGRYRVVLLPALCLAAAWLIGWCWSVWRQRRRPGRHPGWRLAAAVGLLALVTVWGWPSDVRLRASDFIADGKAWEIQRGKGTPQALQAYAGAWHCEPTSAAAAVDYGEALLYNGRPDLAEPVLAVGTTVHPGDFSLRIFYVASLLGNHRPAEAEAVLRKSPPPTDRKSRFLYYYHLGECQRIIGQSAAALESYRQALPLAEYDAQRKQLRQVIQSLAPATNVKP